jgi:hypothetical protein
MQSYSKKILIFSLGSILIVSSSFSLKANEAKDPLKNKTYEQVQTEVAKNLKECAANELEERVKGGCTVITHALKLFSDMENKETWQTHLKRFKDSLDNFNNHVLEPLKQKISAESHHEAAKKQLEHAYKILSALYTRLHAVYINLSQYSGSTNLIDLLELGKSVNKYRSLLPSTQRQLNEFQWKKILEHRLSIR